MKKISIIKIPFKLNGEIIKNGDELSFDALNKNGDTIKFESKKGITVISTFPSINTRVCDSQTMEIARLANKFKNINFISITTDKVEKIKKWCIANKLENLEILSDQNFDFGKKTNTLIKRLKRLARGFIILKDGVVIATRYKKEISKNPDFDFIEKYFN